MGFMGSGSHLELIKGYVMCSIRWLCSLHLKLYWPFAVTQVRYPINLDLTPIEFPRCGTYCISYIKFILRMHLFLLFLYLVWHLCSVILHVNCNQETWIEVLHVAYRLLFYSFFHKPYNKLIDPSFLATLQKSRKFYVTALIIPKQESTSDSVSLKPRNTTMFHQ